MTYPRWKMALSIISTVLRRQFASYLSRCWTSFMMNREKEWLLVFPQFTVKRNSPSFVSALMTLVARSLTTESTLFY